VSPALSREERAAEVLREHQHKRFCWECTCDGQHTYQGDLADRQATLAAHQAAMLAAAGLLADPDALDAAEAEVERLRGEADHGGCYADDGPMEDCSLHGRPVREVWDALGIVQAREAALRERIERLAERYENTSTDRALRPRYDVIAARLRALAADDEGGQE
jgi:hypothetical protein